MREWWLRSDVCELWHRFYAQLHITLWASRLQTYCRYGSHIVCFLEICSTWKTKIKRFRASILSFLQLICNAKAICLVFPHTVCSFILPSKLFQANSVLTWLFSWGWTLHCMLLRLAIFTHCQVGVIASGMTCVFMYMCMYCVPMSVAVYNPGV